MTYQECMERRNEIGRYIERATDYTVRKSITAQVIFDKLLYEAIYANQYDGSDASYIKKIYSEGVMYTKEFSIAKVKRIIYKALGKLNDKDVIRIATGVKENEINTVGTVGERKKIAVHNYNYIINSKEPGAALLAYMCRLNERVLFFEACDELKGYGDEQVENLLKIEAGELSIGALMSILETVCTESNDEEMEEITEEEYLKYSMHKEFDFIYAPLEVNNSINTEMIKSVGTWLKIFNGTEREKKLKESSPIIDIMINSIRFSQKYNSTANLDTEATLGFIELYEKEAYKINDKVIQKYKALL